MSGRQLIQHAVTASLIGLIVVLGLIAARNLPARSATLAVVAPARPAAAPSGQSGSVAYDVTLAVQEANLFAEQPTNRDGCYIYADRGTGANPACNDTTRVGFDGAHFISCVLKAGGLTPPAPFDPLLCNGVNRYISMPYLVAMLNALPIEVRTQDTAELGDILVLRENGVPCWGGVVVETDAATSSGLRIATHSQESGLTDPDNGLHCYRDDQGTPTPTPIPTTQEYVHIVTDSVPPTVSFTGPQAGYVPFDSIQRLTWQGDDGQGGSGIASYTLTLAIAGAPPSELAGALPAMQTSFDVRMNVPCQPITFAITATDHARNPSAPATLVLTATLQGDFDVSGAIDQADLTRLEAAWDLRAGQPGYEPQLDINADGRIDTADTLWLRRRVGDRCW